MCVSRVKDEANLRIRYLKEEEIQPVGKIKWKREEKK